MSTTYTAKVRVGDKTYQSKTTADSKGDAYNKIRSAAASRFPDKNILVLKVEREAEEVLDFLKGIFK